MQLPRGVLGVGNPQFRWIKTEARWVPVIGRHRWICEAPVMDYDSAAGEPFPTWCASPGCWTKRKARARCEETVRAYLDDLWEARNPTGNLPRNP